MQEQRGINRVIAQAQNREPTLGGMAAEATLPRDWLAAVLQGAFQSLADNTEPPPAVWMKIRQRLETLPRSEDEC